MALKDTKVEEIFKYMIKENLTIRGLAARIGIPKTTVHNYFTKKLQGINQELYFEVRKHMQQNNVNKHRKGGLASKRSKPEYVS